MLNKILILVILLILLVLGFYYFNLKANKNISFDFLRIEDKNFNFFKLNFNNNSFDVVNVGFDNVNSIKFYYKDDDGNKIKNIEELKEFLNIRDEKLAFAMNGGIFSKKFEPLGLYIENGNKISDINLKDGEGNFYLKPNGVFVINEKSTNVVETSQYKYLPDDLFAIQSGPALVLDGEINSIFKDDSENKYIRNGVGVNDKGDVFFVISNNPVNFYDFAELFKSELKCKNALYLDGAISEMYVLGKREFTENKFSTMIGIIE